MSFSKIAVPGENVYTLHDSQFRKDLTLRDQISDPVKLQLELLVHNYVLRGSPLSHADMERVQNVGHFLWKNVNIFAVLGKLKDVTCIIHRELYILRQLILDPPDRIVRLDGEAGRMIHMHTLLWELYDDSASSIKKPKKPKLTCVDIDPLTVAAHSRKSAVDQAVHSDVYTFLQNYSTTETLFVYLDFCSLPPIPQNDSSANTCEYNAKQLQLAIAKHPSANWLISHSTQGWRNKANRTNKYGSWSRQLKTQHISASQDLALQKHMFRTSRLSSTNSSTFGSDELYQTAHKVATKRAAPSIVPIDNPPKKRRSNRCPSPLVKKPTIGQIVQVDGSSFAGNRYSGKKYLGQIESVYDFSCEVRYTDDTTAVLPLNVVEW